VYNVQLHESSVTHAKSSKPPGMFQWDAVDTGPDSGGQNVLKTFEMAIRHNRRTTRTELEIIFCRRIYFHLRSKIFFLALLRGAMPPIFGSATAYYPKLSVHRRLSNRNHGKVVILSFISRTDSTDSRTVYR